MSISLREARIDDADLITDFNAAMARETEEKGLDLERLRSGVRALLENPDRGFYLIAERSGDRRAGLTIVGSGSSPSPPSSRFRCWAPSSSSWARFPFIESRTAPSTRR